MSSNAAVIQAKSASAKKREVRKAMVAYSFIAPNFLGFAIFTLGPIILAFIMAFTEWDGSNPMKFIGIQNFANLFGNDRFVAALKNTIVYSIFTVPLTLVAALALAILLNQKIKGTTFFRTVTFFPYVASLVAVAAVWNMLFTPNKGGLMNQLLMKVGLEPLKWAAAPNTVMFTIILFSIWKNMGYYMVIYLAGLQGISEDLYEAASLDGANGWQKFWYVTLPQLKPTTFFVTVMLTISCFKIYDIVYMLAGGSNGVVNKSAIVLVYYIYEEAFRNWKLGSASAGALVLFAIVLIITLIQFRGEKNYAND
ncbi:MAG: sugar ABC transporter permease [Lachnospiraceae bacterium]|nr:sugar ABC transporter permease [Lachnospiraceae bacterium]